MLRQARDAREMATDFPCIYKKKKHMIMKKYLLIINSFSKSKQKSFIRILKN
ncbi:MAG: hypothetical protein Q4A77_08925 [Leptotrichia hongkongensis]|nr:hypothetical protein [Leptotrichia hongkongensis]